MKKFLFTLIAAIAFCGSVIAQTSHWPDFNYHDYMTNRPIGGYVKIGDTFIEETDPYEQFEVAYFVGTECRGRWFMQFWGDDHPIFEGGCFYTTPGESVSFQLYDHSNGILYEDCTPSRPVVTGTPDDNFDDFLVLTFTAAGPSTITATRTITGYGAGNATGHYYLISTPIDNLNPTTVADMLSSNYDLYWFNDAESGTEWRNYEAATFNLTCGKGYLYAHETTITLTFTGTAYTGDGKVTLTKADGTPFAGWNLIGNPFNSVANIGSRAFYKMNDAGTELEAASGNIAVMEGIFVEAENNGEEITFSPTSSDKGLEMSLNITQNSNLVDRAIVSFSDNRSLTKMQLNPNHTKVYIPKDNKDYAVVSAEAQGEMPVNFQAETNGTYNFSFNTENVEFSYLHLIDNMTGKDIDLLATPNYSFEATTSDYASRFRLVFATNNDSNSNFAFINNGEIILNGVNGNTTVQLFDVTGRMLSSTNGASRISTENMAAGVYMLRLVNGNDVKTQKIVVK